MLCLVCALVVVLIYGACRTAERFVDARTSNTDMLRCTIPDVVAVDTGVPGPCIGVLCSVHGNEPAGAYALTRALAGASPCLDLRRLRRGRLIIIPRANPCGLAKGCRENPFSQLDVNRQFTENGGTDATSMFIVNAFKTCDLIIDLHEGWGWHLQNTGSIGSTISPTAEPYWRTLAPRIVDRLNGSIADPKKRFSVIWRDTCTIPEALSCWALTNKRPYLLVETSGQNDVQPIGVREAQVCTVLDTVLAAFGMW